MSGTRGQVIQLVIMDEAAQFDPEPDEPADLVEFHSAPGQDIPRPGQPGYALYRRLFWDVSNANVGLKFAECRKLVNTLWQKGYRLPEIG